MTPLLFAAALAAAGPAQASQGGAPVQTHATGPEVVVQGQRATEPSDPDKVVCRSEPVTGSRFVRRVCETRAQWDRQTQEAKDVMDAIDHNSGKGMPASGPLWGVN